MNAKRFSLSLILLGAALGAAPALAEEESGLALRQNTLTLGWPNRTTGSSLPQGTMGMTETRLRAWTGQEWQGAIFKEAIELQTGYSSLGSTALGVLGGAAPSQSRPFEVWRLDWEQATPSAATTRARVEVLNVAWNWGPVDFKLGRQPVSLGTSHFVGVLDVLSPIAPGSLDGSYKSGIDALRARTQVGDTGEGEVILAGSDPFHRGGAIARVRNSISGMDVELMGGHFRDRGFAGLGWEGEVGQAGVWGELALFQRRPQVEQYRAGWSQAAFSGVVGADFNLPFNTRGGASLLYQDFGARRPQDLASVYTDAPYAENWAFLGSAGYGVLTLSKQLQPLISGSMAGIVNLVDGSSLWQPRLTFSISDNADLGAYGWISLGRPPRQEGTTMVIESEFGLVPTGAGLYARWFF